MAVPLTALAFVVRERVQPVITFDEQVISRATDVTRDHDWLRPVLIAWQEATQPRWLYAVATVVCVVVWRRHGLATRALWAFATMMVAWNLQLVLKEVVQRARPVVSDPISHAPGYSFPSGHAANAAAAVTILVLLLWPLVGPRHRAPLVVAIVTFVLLTALNRVFLGVHYPSDVLAGVVFGVGLGWASYLGYVGWNPPQPKSASLSTTGSAPRKVAR